MKVKIQWANDYARQDFVDVAGERGLNATSAEIYDVVSVSFSAAARKFYVNAGKHTVSISAVDVTKLSVED